MSFETVKAWTRPMSIYWPRVIWYKNSLHFYNEVNCCIRGTA